MPLMEFEKKKQTWMNHNIYSLSDVQLISDISWWVDANSTSYHLESKESS